MSEVFNEDCMVGMSRYPDGYFELAICDPPYGIDFANRGDGSGNLTKHKWKNHKRKQWDKNTPNLEYFEQLFRVSKNQVVFGGNYMTSYLPPSSGWVVWDKGQREFSLADAELAYTSFRVALRIFTYTRGEQMQENTDRIHPTQKPVALYKWLLKNYAKPGDKILDSHGGSMSSVIACLDMGFQITCFEKDPDYARDAKARILSYLQQQKLFAQHGEIKFNY